MNATRAQIAELLGQGLSNAAIAKYLQVRPATVSEIRYDLGLPNVARRNAQCGTDRGSQRHRRRGEQLCDPCRHFNDQAADERSERGTRMRIRLSIILPPAATAADPEPVTDWRHRAECRPGSGHDPELFFPIGNTGPALIQLEEAKAVCRTCPVMEECLRWALDTRQDAGVWGCTSEDERRAMHRRRARNRARTA